MKEIYLKQLKQTSLLSILFIALSGCGQSGPLYLPDEQAEQNKPEQVAPPATPSTKNDLTQEQ